MVIKVAGALGIPIPYIPTIFAPNHIAILHLSSVFASSKEEDAKEEILLDAVDDAKITIVQGGSPSFPSQPDSTSCGVIALIVLYHELRSATLHTLRSQITTLSLWSGANS